MPFDWLFKYLLDKWAERAVYNHIKTCWICFLLNKVQMVKLIVLKWFVVINTTLIRTGYIFNAISDVIFQKHIINIGKIHNWSAVLCKLRFIHLIVYSFGYKMHVNLEALPHKNRECLGTASLIVRALVRYRSNIKKMDTYCFTNHAYASCKDE